MYCRLQYAASLGIDVCMNLSHRIPISYISYIKVLSNNWEKKILSLAEK